LLIFHRSESKKEKTKKKDEASEKALQAVAKKKAEERQSASFLSFFNSNALSNRNSSNKRPIGSESDDNVTFMPALKKIYSISSSSNLTSVPADEDHVSMLEETQVAYSEYLSAASADYLLTGSSISLDSMCLKEGSSSPQLMKLDTNVLANVLICFIYPPSKSAKSGDQLDNNTMTLNIMPILGKSKTYYLHELLPFEYNDNRDVNFAAITRLSKQQSHPLVKLYCKRVRILLKMRSNVGLLTCVYGSGPDVMRALASLLSSATPVLDSGISLHYRLSSGDHIIFSVNHASYSLHTGSVEDFKNLRLTLQQVRIVSLLLQSNRLVTKKAVYDALSESERIHADMVEANKREWTKLVGEKGVAKILKAKPSMFHHTIASYSLNRLDRPIDA